MAPVRRSACRSSPPALAQLLSPGLEVLRCQPPPCAPGQGGDHLLGFPQQSTQISPNQLDELVGRRVARRAKLLARAAAWPPLGAACVVPWSG